MYMYMRHRLIDDTVISRCIDTTSRIKIRPVWKVRAPDYLYIGHNYGGSDYFARPVNSVIKSSNNHDLSNDKDNSHRLTIGLYHSL